MFSERFYEHQGLVEVLHELKGGRTQGVGSYHSLQVESFRLIPDK